MLYDYKMQKQNNPTYNHLKIEPKWQKEWEAKKVNQAKENSRKPKFYGLIEFPYPSGDGLHVGHIRSNTAMDIICRKRRREGYEVLYPIGWDAFGLPTENYAIKTKQHPIAVTKKNTAIFRKQLKAGGFSFDWDREINTTDPKYYKWTQWIFLKFLEKGLAYKKKMPINWCPKCKIGLANEEVINNECERCGASVEKKEKEQWMLAITKYADRLDADLDQVDYLEKIKIQQRNWIGRSEGSELWFNVRQSEEKIRVFTTRPDTLYGVTYLVLAPEGDLVKKLKPLIKNWQAVEKYIKEVKDKTEIERMAIDKAISTGAVQAKTGIRLEGVEAKHPLTKEILPVWIADYVLANYGTGAVMAVPAHDERDFAFAKKYNLPIKQVITPIRIDAKNPPVNGKKEVTRKTIHAIVQNSKTGKILCLKWKKHPWTGFIVGGVDDGEDLVDAARREVREETGYLNLKYIGTSGLVVRGEYFAAHKNENRIAYSSAVLFELENEEREMISKEELEKHEPLWLEPKNINSDNFTCAELDLWFGWMENGDQAYVGDGVLINSAEFDGMDNEEAKKKITELADGKQEVTYRLKDWIFSRQHYWGEPIPVVNCKKCGLIPVNVKDLPLKLPKVKHYEPTDNGESPLASISKWIKAKCPKCKGPAERETDTMPNWAGSSWYYLRYTDPKNSKCFADSKKLKYWVPVDWYNGGMEHTTLHLLYSRFWHKFLYDLHLVPTTEPYQKRTSHGMVLAEGGVKMSKSRGNVINPDSVIKQFGADSLRVYEMFMGPFDQAIAWSTNGIVGVRRFIERVWKLQEKVSKKNPPEKNLELAIHQTIKKVGEDIESMKFNTAISQMMIYVNALEKVEKISQTDYELFLLVLAPFAPHITEEIWANLGHNPSTKLRTRKSIHLEKWPKYDETKIVSEKTTVIVQINGKVRDTFEISINTNQEEVEKVALSRESVSKWLTGKEITKKIFIKGKILSLVTN